MTIESVNETTTKLIMQFGRVISELSFEERMMVVEGVAAGLIAATAIELNKQPDQLTEAFCQGLRERITRAIYGRKQ